jgi:hypothetical protein
VVTRDGLIVSPDGTTTPLAGYGNLEIQRFRGGRIIGVSSLVDQKQKLIEWDLAGHEVRRTSGNTAVGVNANGLLLAWYFNAHMNSTLGTWQNGVFLSDVGDTHNIATVTDSNELAGVRIPDDPEARLAPATWSGCP